MDFIYLISQSTTELSCVFIYLYAPLQPSLQR